MNWDTWPQWVTIFYLALPVIAWPISRAALGGKTDLPTWIGKYLAKVATAIFAAYVLYLGGFWQ